MTIDPDNQSAHLRHLKTAAALQCLPEARDSLHNTLDDLTLQLRHAAAIATPPNSFDASVLSTINRIATTSTFGGLVQRRSLCPLASAAALLLAAPSAFSQPRNPFEYNSLGVLDVVNDNWTFNTTTAQARHGPWPSPDTISGEVRDGAAVFCFDGIYVASGSSIVVHGTRPLVLLSRSSISIRGTISADGWPGFDANNLASGTAFIGFGTGGSGMGGAPAVFTQLGAETPPGVIVGGRGGGPGGGLGGTDRDRAEGGSFGGAGASFRYPDSNTYGNLLRHLEGGSGGGGAMSPAGSPLFGAGGGGAIELGSFYSVDVSGDITSRGGDAYGVDATAGAGSGGGILIHANMVWFDYASQVNVAGGFSPSGSHGGGGRITIQSRNPVPLSGMTAHAGGVGAGPGVINKARHNFDMPTVYEFGNVPVGSSKPIAVHFSSGGDVDTVMNAYFEETSPDSPFARSGSGIVSGIRPGQTGAVVYYFTPPAPGPFSEALTVLTNAGYVQITLTGTGGSSCGTSDFDGDGDFGTDADIEAFFRVLAGGHC